MDVAVNRLGFSPMSVATIMGWVSSLSVVTRMGKLWYPVRPVNAFPDRSLNAVVGIFKEYPLPVCNLVVGSTTKMLWAYLDTGLRPDTSGNDDTSASMKRVPAVAGIFP